MREALPPTFEEALQAAISSRQAAAAASAAAPAATRYRRVQVGVWSVLLGTSGLACSESHPTCSSLQQLHASSIPG